MRKQLVGTTSRFVEMRGQVVEVHFAVPTRHPYESVTAYNARIAQLKLSWDTPGVRFILGGQTPAGKADREALATVRQFIPSQKRSLPLLQAIRKKVNKYPGNSR